MLFGIGFGIDELFSFKFGGNASNFGRNSNVADGFPMSGFSSMLFNVGLSVETIVVNRRLRMGTPFVTSFQSVFDCIFGAIDKVTAFDCMDEAMVSSSLLAFDVDEMNDDDAAGINCGDISSLVSTTFIGLD